MPVCRHCGSRIEKFHKDRCPICGEINPLDGVSSDTIEITGVIDINDGLNNYKPKSKKIFLLLSILIGFSGSSFFYLGYKKIGLLYLLINLLIGGGIFAIFYFALSNLLLGILIPVLLVYLVGTIVGIYCYKNPSLKDAKGNLVR